MIYKINKPLQFTFILISLSLLFGCNQDPNKNAAEPSLQISNNIHFIDSSLTENAEVKALISPYKEKLDSIMSKVINYSIEPLPKQRGVKESALGNLLADLTLSIGDSLLFKKANQHANGSLLNFGGIRTSLPQGPITLSSIFEIMPFDNSLIAVKFNAEGISALEEYLEKSAQPFAGFKLVNSNNKANIIWNKPLPENQTVWIITTSYLYEGGDNMAFFKTFELEKHNLIMLLRDAIILHFQDLANKQQPIKSSIDGRNAL